MMKRISTLSLFVLVCLPLGARASLIQGVLNFTGTANISLGTIAFEDNTFNINSPANTQQGGFTLLQGTTGDIQNITNPPDATGPVVPPTGVPDFITFNDPTFSNISITFTFLDPGIDAAAGCLSSPPAGGQQCTPNFPAPSPFNLQNTSATSSTASFNILGIEVDSTTGDTIPITGAFTTPFSNESFQSLLGTVLAGGTVTTAFSAEFSTAPLTPEPSTVVELMLGIGAIAMGLLFRKRSQRI